MKSRDWNPELYLKFNRERLQPSIDLISRIEFDNPQKIIDVGCGPGNSTQILFKRWPESCIIGIDKSESMINKAKADFPNQKWKLFDAGTDEFHESYDIVYSNATIQWIPNHQRLFQKFYTIVNSNGILAIQIPLFFEMPLGQSINRIARHNQWSHVTKHINKQFTILNYFEYYEILSALFNSINIWVTEYIHIMDSHFSILEMISSTGLKPYIEKLENNDKSHFKKMVLNAIESDYPAQKNGKVLFPFKRLFFIGYK